MNNAKSLLSKMEAVSPSLKWRGYQCEDMKKFLKSVKDAYSGDKDIRDIITGKFTEPDFIVMTSNELNKPKVSDEVYEETYNAEFQKIFEKLQSAGSVLMENKYIKITWDESSKSMTIKDNPSAVQYIFTYDKSLFTLSQVSKKWNYPTY